MSAGGILKPGADTLVNTLVSADVGNAQGQAISGAIPTVMKAPGLFTGKSGVNTVDQLLGSKSAQAKSVVSTLQKGQSALQSVGAITGKEAPGGLGAVVSGTISSVASTGNLGDNVSSVTGAINKVTDGGGISGAVTGATQGVLDTMKSGAKSIVASQLSGAVGGVSKALNTLGSALPDLGVGIDTNIGASASSFKSIVASFGTLELATTVGAGSIEGAFSSATSGATNSVQGIVNQASSAASGAISSAVSDVKSVSSNAETLTQQGTLQNAASQVQRQATATISSTIASGVSNLPGGQKLGTSVVNNAKDSVNQIADGIGGVTDSLSSLGASAFSGTDVGGLVAKGESGLGAIGSLGSVKDNLIGGLTDAVGDAVGNAISGALSPGAAAALESALSALTAGGGSTIKLPTVALNTYDRSSITSLIDGVLGGAGSIIPKPNLLGIIPPGALSAAGALLSLRKSLSSDVKKLNKAQAEVATKQRAVFEAQSIFPAGSPEILAAEASYQSAATSPTLKALINKVESAKSQFGPAISDVVTASTPEAVNTNPFSDIEEAINTASVNNDTINTESNLSQPTGDQYRESTVYLNSQGDVSNWYNENTYSNIIATTTKTFVSPPEPAPAPVVPGEPVIENTVEAIIGEPTDGAGGFGQDVAIGNEMGQGGTYNYTGYATGIGVINWKWDTISMAWEFK